MRFYKICPMILTPEIKKRAGSYEGELGAADQKQLFEHLEALPHGTQGKVIQQIQKNGGSQGEFLNHIFSKEPSKPKAAPGQSSPETKSSKPVDVK